MNVSSLGYHKFISSGDEYDAQILNDIVISFIEKTTLMEKPQNAYKLLSTTATYEQDLSLR